MRDCAYPSYLVGPLTHERDVVTEPLRHVDDHVAVPRGPGLGIDVDGAAPRGLDARLA